MKKALESKIDELYQLPLAEFTNSRNTLAKTLSGAEKKIVSSLTKPSLPMWVINLTYWRDPSTYNALIDAAEKLRAAHRSALSGRKTDTRKPDELHRATVEKAFAKAIGIAEKSGVPLTDTVRETVRRTLAALPGEEPAGRLTRPPEPAGFSLLTGVKIRPEAVAQGPKSMGRGPTLTPRKPSRAELQAQERAESERKAAEKKAQKEKEKREQEIRKAEEALRDAERRLAELKR